MLQGLLHTGVNEICIECEGTDDGVSSRQHNKIPFYRAMYENCTIVTTNLEIDHVTQPDCDLSFFENVREVLGYVLITNNLVGRVPLTSLRVIRGRRLFRWPSQSTVARMYGLFVADNIHSPDGLQHLELPNLMGESLGVAAPAGIFIGGL